jgi:hypothetical protein
MLSSNPATKSEERRAPRRTDAQFSSTITSVSDFASRIHSSAQLILQAVADLNRQAAPLQYEAQNFVTRVRAA